jgi:cytochrome c oxidase assembly protein subunit 15
MEGMLVGILTAGLAIWMSAVRQRPWLRRLAWFALAAVILQGVLGLTAVPPAPPSFSHTFLAHVFFSITVAIAVFTSGGRRPGSEPLGDRGRPTLRSLAVVTPAAVLAQVALGASYRHNALGLMPHIAGAMIVALLILVMGVLVTQRFPGHRSLRAAAIALMTIAFLQVFLGITVITIQALVLESPLPLILSTVAHVATGALTLGATAVVAILIQRDVRAAPE